jgi:hypothetical protein
VMVSPRMDWLMPVKTKQLAQRQVRSESKTRHRTKHKNSKVRICGCKKEMKTYHRICVDINIFSIYEQHNPASEMVRGEY